MANITDLSFELIDRILQFSDWSAYLQLALSCKHLAHYTQRTMAHHRECHALYKATSDISPRTLPALARALLHDPIAISHVWNLEFWGQRSELIDWKPHVFRRSEPQTEAEKEADLFFLNVDMSSCLRPSELDALERLMQKEIRLSQQASQLWRQKIHNGDDGALKGMLIALCPNLRAVRFVQYDFPGHMTEDTWPFEHHQSCLAFLTAAIEAQHEDSDWSPGFLSLSRIALGVPSQAASPEADHRIYPHHTLPLFRLPHLRSLYLNGISLAEDELYEPYGEEPFTSQLPPDSSPNLVELVIGNADLGDNGDYSQNLLNTMFEAATQLRHIAFQGGDISSFDFDGVLREKASQVRSFLVADDVGVHGYRSNMYYPDEVGLPPTFTVDVSDLMLCAPWTEGKGQKGNGLDPKVDKVGRWGTSRSEFGEYIYQAFDEGWESIVFIGDPTEEEADMIDQGLAEFIRRVAGLYEEDEEDEAEEDGHDDLEDESGNPINGSNDQQERGTQGSQDGAPDDEQEESHHQDDADEAMPDTTDDGPENDDEDEPENDDDDDDNNNNNNNNNTTTTTPPPRALYLEGIDATSPHGRRWYTATIRAGREAGIRVHTRTTPAPREHASDLPWPASDKELQTSPLYNHPDLEKYLLKPHAGLVMDDCGNCGVETCNACCKVMSAKGWARARDEDAEGGEFDFVVWRGQR